MIKNLCALLLSMLIPVLLFSIVWQSHRYVTLEKEIALLEKEQQRIVEDNRRMISGISVLSAPERIQRVAVEDMGMRKAETHEIMRISLSKGGLGG